jgi:hypothetical protein
MLKEIFLLFCLTTLVCSEGYNIHDILYYYTFDLGITFTNGNNKLTFTKAHSISLRLAEFLDNFDKLTMTVSYEATGAITKKGDITYVEVSQNI